MERIQQAVGTAQTEKGKEMSDYIKREPTKKQYEYAKDIANYFGIDLPNEYTMDVYADFLNKYADGYRKSVNEELAYYEASLEAIDARRDW